MNRTLTMLLVLGATVPVRGQSFEVWIGGGPSLLSNNAIGSVSTTAQAAGVLLKNGFRINFRMAMTSGVHFGHEVGYAYNRTQLAIAGSPDQGMAIHQGFYNYLAYFTKEGFRIRPFVTGGLHFSNFVPPGVSVTQGAGNTKFGFNYGAGIKVRVAPEIGIRLDYRQYLTGKPFGLPLASGMLWQSEVSAGVGLLL